MMDSAAAIKGSIIMTLHGVGRRVQKNNIKFSMDL